MDTPVALFVFNRPDPTARIFEAIRAARPGRLLVVGDGPRPEVPEDETLCTQTREVVSAVDWQCDVEYLYADENLGCGRRVSSGLDWVFGTVPEAIILEDDCLPHASFFPFAAAMLARYRDDPRVGMIAGTNYISDPERRESYFFSRYFAVWGWAGWRRGWQHYDFEMAGWPSVRERGGFGGLICTPGVTEFLHDAFDRVYAGEIDTWDFQWVYACLVGASLCVVPRVNLVSNIGVSGTHGEGGSSADLQVHPLDSGALVHPDTMVPDRAYESLLYERFLRTPEPPGRWRRLRDLTGRALSRATNRRRR
jgi:hypothetical protein